MSAAALVAREGGCAWARVSDERDRHPERRPVPLAGALRADRAAMQVDEVLHDCEAEPEAAVKPRGGAIRLAEAAEQVRDELARIRDEQQGIVGRVREWLTGSEP